MSQSLRLITRLNELLSGTDEKVTGVHVHNADGDTHIEVEFLKAKPFQMRHLFEELTVSGDAVLDIENKTVDAVSLHLDVKF